MFKYLNHKVRLLLPIVFGFSVLSATTVQADVVSDLLGNQLVCNLAERELADMTVAPLYQVVSGQCASVVPDADDGAWFADENCTTPVTYSRTNMQSYCASASNRVELGNGLGILNDSWTLNPGNKLDLGARSLEGVGQPYMQRLIYRQVQTARGRCDLEMRVYKSHPTVTGQRSMIALHGGSWTSRSFGYLGLELSVPHFVEQGFVVYSPFYRLLDNTDSSSACNQAEFGEIVEDANAALDWVLENSSQYGSGGQPVLFGQSAGAHLALSLSVNRPTSVSGSVLMYPPTDFTDFLQRVQTGAYTNTQGLSVFERVFGTSAEQASLSLPLVVANSFPARIATEGGAWPPMFVVQGSADELVEARQSVRLCDALAGRVLANADEEVGVANELRDVIGCSSSSTEPASTLHLIKLGKHALDVCINPNVPDLCFSGGSASSSLVSQSVAEAATFATAAHEANLRTAGGGSADAGNTDGASMTDSASVVSTGGSGGGVAGLLSLLLAFFIGMRQPNRSIYPPS